MKLLKASYLFRVGKHAVCAQFTKNAVFRYHYFDSKLGTHRFIDVPFASIYTVG